MGLTPSHPGSVITGTPGGAHALTVTSGSHPRGARRLDHLIVALAIGLAPVVGVLLAVKPLYGIALALAALYGVLVSLRLAWGIGLFVPLVFFPYLSIANILIKLAVVLLAVAWLAYAVAHRAEVGAAIRRHGALLTCVGLLLGWMALSLIWADDTGTAFFEAWQWYPPVAVFLIIATTLHTRRQVTALCALFVVGAVASMFAGAVGGGLTAAGQLSVNATPGRLQGGAGDPNILATGLVAAIALAGALIAVAKRGLIRFMLLAAAVVMAVGLVLSGSRGGLIAAAVGTLAAFVCFKRQRLMVFCMVLIVASGLALALAGSSAQRSRFFEFNDGGSGRSALWTVAWRLGLSSPVIGVGVNNFIVRAPERVLDPGSLEHVTKISDAKVAVAHNTLLQSFVDTGIVGLTLLIAVLAAALRTVVRAARAFDRLGEHALGTLARGVLVAQIAMLAAAFFLTMGRDPRWWLLFAIGPVLLNLAHDLSRRESPRPSEARG